MPELPDADRIQRLTRFIPKFQKYAETEEEFGTVVIDTSFYAKYPKVLDSFLSRIEEDGWLESSYSSEEGQRYMETPALLEEANFETLQRLLVFCSRGERFSTGFWKRVVESGFLLGILRRMDKIQERLENESDRD